MMNGTKVIDIGGLGQLRANVLSHGSGRSTLEALNVPFARPPIESLRFRPPQPPMPWSHIHDGTRFGPGCIQNGTYMNYTFPIDEDCLQLNVWAPLNAAPKAVLVWAFGGGLTVGSGVAYNGSKLAQLGNIVVVTINYRLGALGFYSSLEQAAEDTATGGLNGVLDMLQALKFVRAHIGAFGGDPSRVTLAGQSSGAVGSCVLAFSPIATGLFHQLILESGACTGPWMGPDPSVKGSLNASKSFARDVGCATGSLSCLRSLPATRLTTSSQWGDLNFGIDDYLLHAAPANASVASRVPLLIGSNNEDTTCATAIAPPMPPANASALHASLRSYFGDDAEDLLRPYLRAASIDPSHIRDRDAKALWLNMSRDAGASCPSLWLARRFTSLSLPVYMYELEFNETLAGEGVLHGGELDLVWQRPPATSLPAAADLAAAVGHYWSSFVSTGVPAAPSSWPAWPRFEAPTNAPSDRFLDFTSSGRAAAKERFRTEACEMWESYRAKGESQRQRFTDFGYLC